MRSACVLLLALGLSLAAPEGATAQHASPRESLGAWLAQIDRVRTDVQQLDERHPEQVAQVMAEVPPAWTVATADRSWTIPAEWLRDGLAAWGRQPDARARARILERLRWLRSQTASVLDSPRDSSQAHAKLDGILSAREFQDAHGPTWLQMLTARVLRSLLAWLARIIGSSAVPTVADIVVYAVIALAILAIGVGMYRALARSDEDTSIRTEPAPMVSWTGWLTQARRAAAAGDWPHAIRSAYWCGVMFLEARGAWQPDPSRTPREYVRLLPPSGEQGLTLRALTELLERVWYRAGPADAASFDEALAQLQKLGCPTS